MLNGLHFVMAHVPDVEEATRFYTETLGMTVTDSQPDFVQFAAPGGGAILALGKGSAIAPPESIELWWFVDSADAMHDALVARGVQNATPVIDEPFGRTFTFKDPAGNTLSILQPAQA